MMRRDWVAPGDLAARHRLCRRVLELRFEVLRTQH
jgi:hypothetical protein